MASVSSPVSLSDLFANSFTVDSRDAHQRLLQTTHHYAGFKIVTTFTRDIDGLLTGVSFASIPE